MVKERDKCEKCVYGLISKRDIKLIFETFFSNVEVDEVLDSDDALIITCQRLRVLKIANVCYVEDVTEKDYILLIADFLYAFFVGLGMDLEKPYADADRKVRFVLWT